MADNVYDRIQLVNVELQDNGINSYFIDELTDQVIRDLVEQKGYTETQAYKTLYQSGLTIYSTQDMDIQNIADEEVNNQTTIHPVQKFLSPTVFPSVRPMVL